MIPNTIRIRELLFVKRKSQTWLSKETGITRNTINAICNGKSCSEETVRKIASVLDVSIDEISAE